MLDVVVPGVDTPPAAQLCLACRVSLACVTAKVAIAPIPQLLALSVREFGVNKLSLHCACGAATNLVPRQPRIIWQNVFASAQ
jgi:hypothetical protein